VTITRQAGHRLLHAAVALLATALVVGVVGLVRMLRAGDGPRSSSDGRPA